MNSSLYSVNVLTSVSSEPKKLFLNVKGLAMMAVAGVGYGVDAEGKGFRVIIIDGGSGWYGVASHIKNLYHR